MHSAPAPRRPARRALRAAACCLCLWHAAPGADDAPGGQAGGAASLGGPAGLAQLYNIALDSDPQYHAQRAAQAARKTARPIARAQLLPQLTASAGTDRIAKQKFRGRAFGVGEEGGNEFTYSERGYALSLNQSLYNRERLLQLRRSRSEDELAEVLLRAARQDLIVRLAEAYFAALYAQSDLEFARREKEAVAKQREQASERFALGLTPITDAKEAEAAHDLAVAEEIAAANRLDNALNALEAILGQRPAALAPMSQTFAPAPPAPDTVEHWVDAAVAGNLGLLAQRISVNMAMTDVHIERAAHFPTLDLRASKSQDEARGGPSRRTVDDARVGVALSLPLFSGGATYYRTRRAEAEHRELLERLETEHREVRRASREAYFNVITSISRVAALARAEDSARQALASNREGFAVGTRTSVEVLLALKDLFGARRDHTQTRHEYILGTLRLKRAVGSLSDADVADVERFLARR